jgi:hypothetical protein
MVREPMPFNIDYKKIAGSSFFDEEWRTVLSIRMIM